MKRLFLFLTCAWAALTGLYAGDEVYYSPDEEPEFIGGEEAMYNWFEDNMRPICDCSEKVGIWFVVQEDGSITHIEMSASSKIPGHNEEALRLVRTMPRWKPGKVKGRVVKCHKGIWVYFQGPVRVTDEGSIVRGRMECCADEFYEWTLDKNTQVLTIGGRGKVKWDRHRWSNVKTVHLYGTNNIDFLKNRLNIQQIIVSDGNPNYGSVEGLLTNKEKNKLILCPPGLKTQKFVIPASITSIEKGAFDNVRIDTLVIPSTVSGIEDAAFEKAKIKCFVVKDNPRYAVKNGVLYYTTDYFHIFPSALHDIPFITPERFVNEVLDYTQPEVVYKGKKPIVLIVSADYMEHSRRFTRKIKMLREAYRDVVDFYLIDGAKKTNSDLLKSLDAKIPMYFMFNGEYNGKWTYAIKGIGDTLKSWDDYERFKKYIEDMLSGVTTR